jgi:tetratricopeptide (TPR) repeat protein
MDPRFRMPKIIGPALNKNFEVFANIAAYLNADLSSRGHRRMRIFLILILTLSLLILTTECEAKAYSQRCLECRGTFQEIADCVVAGDDIKAAAVARIALENKPQLRENLLGVGRELEPKDLTGQAAVDRNNGTDTEVRVRRCIAQFNLLRAKDLLLAGRYDLALSHYRRAEALDGQNSILHWCAATEMMEQNNPYLANLALEHLQKARELGFESVTMPGLVGIAYLQAGNLEAGLSALWSAIATIPNCPENNAFRSAILDSIVDAVRVRNPQAMAPVPVACRKYSLGVGTKFWVVKKDRVQRLVTLAIMSRRDPDGGAQDGVNDGIIQVPIELSNDGRYVVKLIDCN